MTIKRKEGVFSRVILDLMALFLMGYSLFCPARTVSFAATALSLCARAVVPSLAVFLIGAKILIKTDFCGFLSRTPLAAFRRPFSISSGGLLALLIGLTAGFPMGAVVLAALCRAGQISAEEAASLLPFCNSAGAGFVIGTVGAVFFGDATLGAMLFAAQLCAALTGVLLTRGKRRAFKEPPAVAAEVHRSVWSILPAAVGEGALALLSICGFVLFFCVLSDAVLDALAYLGLLPPPLISAALRGFFEISGGFAALGALALPRAGALALSGAMLGFGGISVMMQVADRAAGAVPLFHYLRGRLLLAALCAGYAFLFGMAGTVARALFAVLFVTSAVALFVILKEKYRNRINKETIFQKRVENRKDI